MGVELNSSFVPCSFAQAHTVAGDLDDAETASIACQRLSLCLTTYSHLKTS